MDVEPAKRLPLGELSKYVDDRWLRKASAAKQLLMNTTGGGTAATKGGTTDAR